MIIEVIIEDKFGYKEYCVICDRIHWLSIVDESWDLPSTTHISLEQK